MPPGHENVLPSIVIEIDKRRTVSSHPQRSFAHTTRRRDLTEVALTGILKQWKCLIIECHVDDVGISVVVVIAKVETHAGDEIPVLRKRDPGFKRNFIKLVPHVMKERIV